MKNKTIYLMLLGGLVACNSGVPGDPAPTGDETAAKKAYPSEHGFGGKIISGVDDFLAQLEKLVTTQEELDALNDLGELASDDSTASRDEPLEAMELEDLVQAAGDLESEIAEDFAEMRAAEMAQIEGSTLEEALGKVAQAMETTGETTGDPGKETPAADGSATVAGKDEPTPGNSPTTAGGGSGGEQSSAQETQGDRSSDQSKPGGNAEAGGSPASSTVGDLQRYRGQMKEMGREATAHWTKAINMAHQASLLGGRGEDGQSAEAFQTGKSPGAKGTGGGRGGGVGGEDSGSKTSNQASDGTATAFKASTAGGSGLKGLKTKIPSELIKAKALPGRRFRQESQRQGWLFIDTWYVIGPWENRGRLAYEVTHPPEVEIDLDASYQDGKLIDPKGSERYPLRWTFVQSDIMRITPPNERGHSTYYAYTEVYFDEPARMLVAIATDDAARMWVNDQLVWEDQGLSGWHLNEGFRVIDFKQGFNKFLVRIENSPVLCEFSVLLCPPDQVK